MTAEGGDPTLIGRTVAGKFVVEKFLGGGAMGAVYRAKQAALEKDVALKVMHRTVAVDPSFVARFHREAKAASRLDHPNSMRVLDFGEEPDGLLYIAMEYLEGRDLYRVIHEDWPLSNERIGDILMQALAAIAVAHDMGVIHRDLKPENIMILRGRDDDGANADVVKVCDFGVAKITDKDDTSPQVRMPREPTPSGQRLTTHGLVVGTPEYMSPEQARGEKLDARSDVYSMGILLYQLLTGRTPFMADTALAVVLKHITEDPDHPSVIYPGVHPRLAAVCMRALAKAREERYQSAREMRGAIRAAIDGRSSRPLLPNSSVPPAFDRAAVTLTEVPAASSSGGVSLATTRVPPIIGGETPSKATPLGTTTEATTSSWPPAPRRSRATVGIAVVALIVGIAGGTALAVARKSAAMHPTPANPPPTAETAPKPPAVAPPPPTTEPAPASSHDSKSPKKTPASSSSSRSSSHPKSHDTARPAPTTEDLNSPPFDLPTPDLGPQSGLTPGQSFNAALCRAEIGSPHPSISSTSRELSLGGAGGAWTSCAQRSLRERPMGAISTSIHVRFSDRSLKGATCHGCPVALAQCIASQTRGAALTVKGESPGDSDFDVPVKFVCD